MLMLWKRQQLNQDNAIGHALLRRIHPPFIPVTRLKCSYGKIFQPAYQDPGCKNRDPGNRASPPSHMNTSKILHRIQSGNARSWKPGQPGQGSSCDEALTITINWMTCYYCFEQQRSRESGLFCIYQWVKVISVISYNVGKQSVSLW